jgi:hypothetical protein
MRQYNKLEIGEFLSISMNYDKALRGRRHISPYGTVRLMTIMQGYDWAMGEGSRKVADFVPRRTCQPAGHPEDRNPKYRAYLCIRY